MVVICPKCGFSQPKDRFCASCGIDIDNFQPVRGPWYLGMLTHWGFQLAVFVIAAVGIFGAIKVHNEKLLQEHAPEAEAFTHISDPRTSPPSAANPNSGAAASTPAQANAPAAAGANNPQPGTAAIAPNDNSQFSGNPTPAPALPEPTISTSISRTAEIVAGDAPPPSNGKATAPSKIRVVFAEMGRNSIAEMLAETRNLNTYGTFNSGLLIENGARFATGKGGGVFNLLDTAADMQIKLNQPAVAFKGSRDTQTGQNLGITAQVTPMALDETSAKLQIEVHRAVRDAPSVRPPIAEQNFQEEFALSKGQVIFMSGVFPRRPLSEDETKLLNSPILKVLSSPDFQAGNTEFVIFFEGR